LAEAAFWLLAAPRSQATVKNYRFAPIGQTAAGVFAR